VPAVTRVWSSPYRRTWQTAEILHGEAGWPDPTACAELEPDRGLEDMLAHLHAAAERDCIGLVGHEPELRQLVARLLLGRTRRTPLRFKKGAAAALRFDGAPRAGAATLLWFLPPAALRAADAHSTREAPPHAS
jgi:phosphohistidine phosphatase